MNWQASYWARADGRITSIILAVKHADVSYEYFVRGRHYVGERVSFLRRGSGTEKNYIADTYEIGENVDVFFDQHDPSNAVLEIRELKDGYFGSDMLLLIVAAFALAAAVYEVYRASAL